jgi:hypothetical protein
MDDSQVSDLAFKVQSQLTEMFVATCTDLPDANRGALLAIFFQGTMMFLATTLTKLTHPQLSHEEAADRANTLCEQLVAAQRTVFDSKGG